MSLLLRVFDNLSTFHFGGECAGEGKGATDNYKQHQTAEPQTTTNHEEPQTIKNRAVRAREGEISQFSARREVDFHIFRAREGGIA